MTMYYVHAKWTTELSQTISWMATWLTDSESTQEYLDPSTDVPKDKSNNNIGFSKV